MHGDRREARLRREKADAFVLFGITGDLAYKMLLPALYAMEARKELGVPVIGVALTDLDIEGLRKRARASLTDAKVDVDEAVFKRFAKRLHLVAGPFDNPATFTELAKQLGVGHVRRRTTSPCPRASSVPWPRACTRADLADKSRLVVEKPFGHDGPSALALDEELKKFFPEERIFRVDHFLGKESVEDILAFRFANMLMEPIWNSSYIRTIQITMAETFGIEDRGSFYDPVGAIRDVVQNHLLQVLALLTMEPPASERSRRDARREIQGAPGDQAGQGARHGARSVRRATRRSRV